jgi:hypothetical protein
MEEQQFVGEDEGMAGGFVRSGRVATMASAFAMAAWAAASLAGRISSEG